MCIRDSAKTEDPGRLLRAPGQNPIPEIQRCTTYGNRLLHWSDGSPAVRHNNPPGYKQRLDMTTPTGRGTFEPRCLQRICVDTVSYTHLDVYKRQI